MALTCLVRITCTDCIVLYTLCPTRKNFMKPYAVITFLLTKVVMFGQYGWILASLFFCVFMDRNSVSVMQKMNMANMDLDLTLG